MQFLNSIFIVIEMKNKKKIAIKKESKNFVN